MALLGKALKALSHCQQIEIYCLRGGGREGQKCHIAPEHHMGKAPGTQT